MNRLIHAQLGFTNGSRGQHTDGTGNHACFIRQNITEQVAGHNDIKLSRIANQLHRSIVHIHILIFNLRIFLTQLMHGLAPYTGGFQNICLIYRNQLLAALHCHVKATTSDTLYLSDRIVHVIPAGFTQFALTAATLTEVNITG